MFHNVVLVIVGSNRAVLAENRCFRLFATHAGLAVVAVTSASAVSVRVVVNAVGILRWCLLAIQRSLNIFGTRPRLNICNIHISKSFSSCSRVSRSMHLLCKLARIVDLILFIIRLMWINMLSLIFLNLPRLQTASLVFLVNLIWLFLRASVEIATGHRKLFHLNLGIDRVIVMRLLRMIFVSRISIFSIKRLNLTFLT